MLLHMPMMPKNAVTHAYDAKKMLLHMPKMMLHMPMMPKNDVTHAFDAQKLLHMPMMAKNCYTCL